MLVAAMNFISCNVLNVNSLKSVSMNDRECKIRPQVINVNRNEPLFYPYNVKVNKCRGNCKSINDPYAKFCVSDTAKNIKVKVSNLMSKTNEARHIKWHETCKCKCRLDTSVCNNKKRWNEDKC